MLRHHIALVVALVVALVAGLPQVIVRHKLGPLDRGVPYLVNDSEGEYLSRVHEILDGHYTVASPTLYEYKDATVLMPPTGEFIFYALPVMITGLSLATMVAVSKFLYPALLFSLVYLLIGSLLTRQDRGARITAIAGGLLVVLGYDVVDYRHFIGTILHGSGDAAGLLWNRLVNPITGALVLFAYLWMLSRMTKGKSSQVTVVAAGVLFGISSGYFFSFALCIAITLLLAAFYAFQRKWSLVRRTVTPLVLGGLLNLPYLIGVGGALRHVAEASDPRKAGMFFTHEPLINLVALTALGVSALCYWLTRRSASSSSKTHESWWYFVGATALAGLLVYNQQILTGRAVWPQHFVQYTTPLAIVIAVVLFHNIVRNRWHHVWRVALISIGSIVFLFAWRGFEAGIHDTLPRYAKLQTFAGVAGFLNAHAEKDCVVYVSAEYANLINRFIPALTSCNVYHSYYIYSGVPRERILHNYLVNLRLRGIALRDVRKHFYADPFFTTSYFFRDWNDMLCNNISGCGDSWQAKFANKAEIDRWFASTQQVVERGYAVYLRQNMYDLLTRYRVDYFVVDIAQQPQVNPTKYPFLVPQGVFDGYAIYSVASPSGL